MTNRANDVVETSVLLHSCNDEYEHLGDRSVDDHSVGVCEGL